MKRRFLAYILAISHKTALTVFSIL